MRRRGEGGEKVYGRTGGGGRDEGGGLMEEILNEG